MKKLGFIISIVLCVTLLFNGIAAFADAMDDGVMSLEEAKALALKNDVQYNLQDSYIEQAKKDYDEAAGDYTKNVTSKGTIADKVASEISRDVSLDNAALNVTKAISNKVDLKRSSDNEVTGAFYDVINGKYSLANAEADMELKKRDLETAQIKFELSIITKDSLSQAEVTYESSQTAYNNTILELQNRMSKLSKSIGKDLDVAKDKLDMTLTVPDINSLDLNKIKEDNLKNNSSYYSANQQYKSAEYKLLETQDKYDYYYEKFKNSSTVRDDFDNMVYEAQRDFDDVKYSYNEKLSDLDTTLSTQYTNIKNLYDSYVDQKKEYEDTKLTIEGDKIKYQMGLISKVALDSSEASLNKLFNKLNTTIMSLNTQYMNMVQYSMD